MGLGMRAVAAPSRAAREMARRCQATMKLGCGAVILLKFVPGGYPISPVIGGSHARAPRACLPKAHDRYK